MLLNILILQCCALYYCHLVCDNFVTTYCWLPFKLANQNGKTMGGRVVKCHVSFLTNDNSASHGSHIFIGQMLWIMPSQSC